MDKTYCIFGDSVTQAAYVKTGWVEMLRQYLEEKYPNDWINVFNLGVGGNTTNDLIKRLDNECSVRIPTHIVIAIGVNDSDYIKDISNPLVEENIFRQNLEKLINLALKYTVEITFIEPVLGDDSILKPFPTSDGSEEWSYDWKRLENYCQTISDVATSKNCKFIKLLDKLITEDFMDGLHPNDEGHRKMFEVIKNYF